MAKKRKLLTFDSYLPSELSKRDPRELRKEYTRLRDIAQKRLKTIGASEFKTSTAYQLNVNKYKKLRNMQSEKELISKLSDLSKFVSARSSKVTGQREIIKDRLNTLHESGYFFVNKENLKEFGTFMNYIKALFPQHPSARDGGEAATMFQGYKELRNKDISAADMQELFVAFLEKNIPDSYLLKPAFTDIPSTVKKKTPWD